MKKLIFILICSFIFNIQVFGQAKIADEVEKITFTFAEKDTSILKLDKYCLKRANEKQPCLFFVFGGGFANGKRDNPSFSNYFEYFAKQGFTVIAIDYRLGMKGQKKIGIGNYEPLKNAIDMAVDDLFDATNYVLRHADEWNVDTTKFILSGSSAGAITVLQAEYENRNKRPLSLKLPESFNYAGIISFAGAIFSTEGGLKWNNEPCPVYFFHGEQDKTVPYNKIRFFKLGFFGSKNIAGHFKKEGFSYVFASYKNAAHEISTVPMRENKEEILRFIQVYVLNKRKVQVDMEVNEI